MKTITLNNGVEMPTFGFGTYQLWGEDCTEKVLAAIAAGYRLIDTAQAYENEEAVGNAIATCGVPREELFITTKVWYRSFENARETVEASMKKLQVEYLDLVLIHWPFANYYAAWRDLEALYAEGKIRAIGVSNFDYNQMVDLIEFNKVVPAVNQIETHVLFQRKAEHKWLKKLNVAHQAYSPLGQGRKKDMLEIPALVEIAKANGKTPGQIALRFLLQSDVAIIPKSAHIERIRENLEILDFELSEAEMETLRGVDEELALIAMAKNYDDVESLMRD